MPSFTKAEMAELVGGLAHELRNPLSTLIITLNLLAEDLQHIKTPPEDTRRRALKKVDVLRREAERLESLLDDFLNLATVFQLDRTETDVNEIVAELVSFFEPQAGNSDINMTLALSRDLLPCPVDGKLLRQALLNIIINAQQAMPDGGTLHIATHDHHDGVVISVSDTGVGIAGKDSEQVFRPFFSTSAGGSGLGLSISRRIIREHGGSLGFESKPGRGTTFTIRLPRPTET